MSQAVVKEPVVATGDQLRVSAPALEVRDLVTEFRTEKGNLRAVNGVSFSVQRGEVLAVIGESGSGKSAMLRSILASSRREP